MASDDCSAVTVESDLVEHAPACGETWADRYRFTATDGSGKSASFEATVSAVDTIPPEVEADPDGDLCLWPPAHRLDCFDASDIQPVVRDACDARPAWRFTGCASDQPDDAPAGGRNGDGSTTADCIVLPDGDGFCVRAERAAAGDNAAAGRTYTVTAVGRDACGNDSEPVAVGMVHVPHRGPGRGCLDPTRVGCRPHEPVPCGRR